MSSNLVDTLRGVRQRLEAGESVPHGEVPEAVAVCAYVDAHLRRSLVTANVPVRNHEGNHDRLLTVDEAARKLGCSKDRLYRHPPEFSVFERRIGRQLRFSEIAIDKYIASGGNGN
ncbi:MAG TPA: helix-turn-helix domain-containing protein [Acidobacteriota bacterium]|nr:helix-turn-helix domain-containing protein [Acidobacteriota bacterium]